MSFVSAKSRVDEFFGRGGCTDGNLEETISYEINRPLPLTLQLFHPCFHFQTSQVKFYCDIRLAFDTGRIRLHKGVEVRTNGRSHDIYTLLISLIYAVFR